VEEIMSLDQVSNRLGFLEQYIIRRERERERTYVGRKFHRLVHSSLSSFPSTNERGLELELLLLI
jgi:hypothetical protein